MNDKYLALMLVCFVALSCKTKQSGLSINHTTAARVNSLAPPKVTIIADLPDSLKPKVALLDKMPGPFVVKFTERAGGSYIHTNELGVVQKIDLMPPVRIPLPLLKNKNGEIIKDKQGNPFIMGDGGISNFTNYSLKDGLAQNGVLCSMIDHSGNLWVGTDGAGVSRYDGKTFTTFNKSQGLAGVYVFSVTEDSSGNLWFLTLDAGVSRYDGKTFTTFNTGISLSPFSENVVVQMAQDKSRNFWFVIRDGSVKCFAGKTYNSLDVPKGLEDVKIEQIFRDDSGNLWFCTDKGARRYDGAKFKSYTTMDGLANNHVADVIQDKLGNFWFGTSGGGISRFDGKHFTTFTTADGLADNYIVEMMRAQSGDLWFITLGGGVSRYDGKGFTSFTTDQGLAGNEVHSLSEDLSGNTWVGVYGEGLSRYNGNAFTFFGTSQGLTSNVSRIFEDKAGNLWLASHGGGVTRYDGETFTRFTSATGPLTDYIEDVTEDQLEISGLEHLKGYAALMEKLLPGSVKHRASLIMPCIVWQKIGTETSGSAQIWEQAVTMAKNLPLLQLHRV